MEFLNYKDIPEEIRQELDKTGLVRMGRTKTFLSRYFLVYGTLRWGMGNWRHYFEGRTIHRGTLRLQGFMKSVGIACQYTGNPEHHTVFDLFEVSDDKYLNDINKSTDSLEGIPWGGGYEACAVKLELDGQLIVAKFYEMSWANPDTVPQERIEEDYVARSYETNQTSPTFKQRINDEAPASVEFYKDKFDFKVKVTE